jgi:hypothetical protein
MKMIHTFANYRHVIRCLYLCNILVPRRLNYVAETCSSAKTTFVHGMDIEIVSRQPYNIKKVSMHVCKCVRTNALYSTVRSVTVAVSGLKPVAS